VKSILPFLAFAAVSVLPAFAGNITGTADFEGGIAPNGSFTFAGSDFSISGSGFSCAGMPNQIFPPAFSFEANVGAGCGSGGPGYGLYGSAIVDGINYGEVQFNGYVDTWASGAMTWDQFEFGGSSESPTVTNVFLQGCVIDPNGHPYCINPILFTLQFNVSGMDTTTWYQYGECCSVIFQTTPEPASAALLALGIVMFGRKIRRRESPRAIDVQ